MRKNTTFTKTLLTGAMVAAASLSAVMPVFADGNEGVMDELTITKVYEAPNSLQQEETYTFTINPSQPKDGAGADHKAGVGTITSTITIGDKKNETVEDDKISETTNIDFSQVSFEAPGIYHYTVEETAGHTQGMNYDSSKKELEVYVQRTEGGKLEVAYYVAKNENGEKIPLEFTNKVDKAELVVEKIIKGTGANDNDEFEFTIEFALEDGCTSVDQVVAKLNGEETDALSLKEKNIITLKGGDVLTVPEIPAGVTYTVTETEALDYAQSVAEDSDDVTAQLKANKTKNVKIVNTKDQDTPTGIALSVAPYIGAILVAFAAGLVLFLKRKVTE